MENHRHHIYFESELWQQLERAAAQCGLSRSGFIRQAVREKMAQKVDRRPTWQEKLAADCKPEEVPAWLRPPT